MAMSGMLPEQQLSARGSSHRERLVEGVREGEGVEGNSGKGGRRTGVREALCKGTRQGKPGHCQWQGKRASQTKSEAGGRVWQGRGQVGSKGGLGAGGRVWGVWGGVGWGGGRRHDVIGESSHWVLLMPQCNAAWGGVGPV